MGKDDFSWNILNILVSFCWDMQITKSSRNVRTGELMGCKSDFMEIPTLVMTLTQLWKMEEHGPLVEDYLDLPIKMVIFGIAMFNYQRVGLFLMEHPEHLLLFAKDIDGDHQIIEGYFWIYSGYSKQPYFIYPLAI